MKLYRSLDSVEHRSSGAQGSRLDPRHRHPPTLSLSQPIPFRPTRFPTLLRRRSLVDESTYLEKRVWNIDRFSRRANKGEPLNVNTKPTIGERVVERVMGFIKTTATFFGRTRRAGAEGEIENCSLRFSNAEAENFFAVSRGQNERARSIVLPPPRILVLALFLRAPRKLLSFVFL